MLSDFIEVLEDGEEYINARKLFKWLEYSRTNDFIRWVNRTIKNSNLIQDDDYVKKSAKVKIENTNISQKRSEFFIKVKACKKIIFNSQNLEEKFFEKIKMFYDFIAEKTGEEFKAVRGKRKELEFCEMLERILTPLGVIIEKQVSVINYKYRIDFIIGGSIAVEYDEYEAHKYSKESDEKRMNEIDEYIDFMTNGDFGVKWIRIEEGKEFEGISNIFNALVSDGIIESSNEKNEINQATFNDNLFSNYNIQKDEVKKYIDEMIKSKFN